MATSRVSKKASKHSKGTKKSSKSMKTKKTKTSKKSKSSKKSMPKDNAYCLRCRKQTKMSDIKTKTTKNGRKQLVGMGDCKHTVYTFA